MIAAPDIDELLSGPLGGWLGEQATVREDAKAQSAARWWKAAMFGLPVLAFFWIIIPGLFDLKMWGSVALGGLAFAWGNMPRRRAIKQTKIGINDAIAGALELGYAHDVEPGQAFGLAQAYKMVPHYDRSRFEDHWFGEVGGRGFGLHEAHLKERRNSGKNTRYVTVFRGVVMHIDFARDFHGTTLVERADKHRKMLGLGGRKDSVKFDGHELAYVDMVHPDFDDAFRVFSDDQVEARYLVHPGYVERLLEVQRAFRGKNVRAIFSGGELVIVMETENLFESGSIEARDDRARIERTVAQFVSLANLAQSLNETERGFAAA
jgi:hypothetical protein